MRQFVSFESSPENYRVIKPSFQQIKRIVTFLNCSRCKVRRLRCSTGWECSEKVMLYYTVYRYVINFDFHLFDPESLSVSPDVIRDRIMFLVDCPKCARYEHCVTSDSLWCASTKLRISFFKRFLEYCNTLPICSEVPDRVICDEILEFKE